MDTIDWDDIYPQLLAFSDQYLKKHDWFRGKGCETSVQGKQADDYVQEAISEHLYHPGKFNAAKGSLLNYLKFSIIRRLYSNDSKGKENTEYRDVFETQVDNDDENSMSYEDSILPYIAATFDEDIDYETIMLDIKHHLRSDPHAFKVFELTRRLGYKRRDVINENHLTDDEFDNGMKRLNRILEKVAIKYSIKKAS
jgi:hypothetical protein